MRNRLQLALMAVSVAAIVSMACTGVAAQESFKDAKLIGKYVLATPDLAKGIKMGMGSSLTHIPEDPDNVFYSSTDRGPNGEIAVGNVICVILDDRYQRENGLDSLLGRRFNSFTSWLPHLPGYYDLNLSGQQASRFLLWLDIMSKFEVVCTSKWFKDCIAHLEGFRTSNGTYLFPKEYLRQERFGYYINGFVMGLEKGRNQRSLEIESTFRMSILKARMKYDNEGS